MACSFSCHCEERRKPIVDRAWVVWARRCHYSAFNGYHKTSSSRSTVRCLRCGAVGRTSAAYVAKLADCADVNLTLDQWLQRRESSRREKWCIPLRFQATPSSCFRACVGLYFDIPESDVPEACAADTWDFQVFQKWLAMTRQLQAVEICISDGVLMPPVEPVLCILTGNSPRVDGLHAVLAEFTKDGFYIVHDPYGQDVDPITSVTHVMFFVAIGKNR